MLVKAQSLYSAVALINQKFAISKFLDLKKTEFWIDFGVEDAVRLSPYKDDKPKDAEITLFKASPS